MFIPSYLFPLVIRSLFSFFFFSFSVFLHFPIYGSPLEEGSISCITRQPPSHRHCHNCKHGCDNDDDIDNSDQTFRPTIHFLFSSNYFFPSLLPFVIVPVIVTIFIIVSETDSADTTPTDPSYINPVSHFSLFFIPWFILMHYLFFFSLVLHPYKTTNSIVCLSFEVADIFMGGFSMLLSYF